MLFKSSGLIKLLVVLLMLAAPAVVNAQKIKSISPAANGDTVVVTTTETVGKIENRHSTVSLQAYASKEHGTVTLFLEVSKDGRPFSLSQDVNVVFTLGDFSTLDLPNQNGDPSVRVSNGDERKWLNVAVVDIANKTIARISSGTIRIIRIQADDRNFDFYLKLEASKKIAKMLALALNGSQIEKKSL